MLFSPITCLSMGLRINHRHSGVVLAVFRFQYNSIEFPSCQGWSLPIFWSSHTMYRGQRRPYWHMGLKRPDFLPLPVIFVTIRSQGKSLSNLFFFSFHSLQCLLGRELAARFSKKISTTKWDSLGHFIDIYNLRFRENSLCSLNRNC